MSLKYNMNFDKRSDKKGLISTKDHIKKMTNFVRRITSLFNVLFIKITSKICIREILKACRRQIQNFLPLGINSNSYFKYKNYFNTNLFWFRVISTKGSVCRLHKFHSSVKICFVILYVICYANFPFYRCLIVWTSL